MAGVEGAGVGLLGAGEFAVGVLGEARGLVGVEFKKGGPRGEGAGEVEVVVRGPQVDVEHAQGPGRQDGEEAVERGTVEGGALGEAAEDERAGGGGEQHGVGVGGDLVPRDAGGDLVMGVAGFSEGGDDVAGGQAGAAGDERCIQIPSTEAAQDLFAEDVAADGGEDARVLSLAGEVVGDVGGGAAEEETFGEEVPEDLAVAEDGGMWWCHGEGVRE